MAAATRELLPQCFATLLFRDSNLSRPRREWAEDEASVRLWASRLLRLTSLPIFVLHTQLSAHSVHLLLLPADPHRRLRLHSVSMLRGAYWEAQPWYRLVYTKLHAWNLPCKRVALMDYDMIPIQAPEAVFDACSDDDPLCAVKDVATPKRPGTRVPNAGLLVLSPAQATFNSLVAAAARELTDGKVRMLVEQGFLYSQFPNWTEIPFHHALPPARYVGGDERFQQLLANASFLHMRLTMLSSTLAAKLGVSREMRLLSLELKQLQGLKKHDVTSFAPTPSVRCVAPDSARLGTMVPASVHACMRRCLTLPGCVAVERFLPNSSCVFFSECLHREHAEGHIVAHYRPSPLPFPAAHIRWRTGVAVVVASYRKNLSDIATFLRNFTQPADLVVYHKHDFNGSIDVPNGWWQHVLDECGLSEHRKLLSYLQVLPNHGKTKRTAPNEPSGGSREPYVFLQFLVDFYDNLPTMVLFSQDDHHNRGMYASGVANNALVSMLAGESAAALATYATVARRPDGNSCFCRIARNGRFNTTGFYPIIAGLRNELFGQSTSVHDPTLPGFEHTFPMAARFAIGRADVLARPRWLYELLVRLTTAEQVWYWISSTYIANVFERLWFVLFDVELRVRSSANATALRYGQRIDASCQPADRPHADPLDWSWEFQTACEASIPRHLAPGGFHAMMSCAELASGCPAPHPIAGRACTLCKW